ncbi:MAG: gamma-glutamyl-phosphate reductase, partial [Gammaproteobacteria bacterium]
MKVMQETIKELMQTMGKKARQAARELGRVDTGVKNRALNAMADAIESAEVSLLVENKKDMDAGAESGLDAALLDRLELNSERIAAIAEGLRQVAG